MGSVRERERDGRDAHRPARRDGASGETGESRRGRRTRRLALDDHHPSDDDACMLSLLASTAFRPVSLLSSLASSSARAAFSTSPILEATKKGGGSSKNNRGTAGKRLGVKKFGGRSSRPFSLLSPLPQLSPSYVLPRRARPAGRRHHQTARLQDPPGPARESPWALLLCQGRARVRARRPSSSEALARPFEAALSRRWLCWPPR